MKLIIIHKILKFKQSDRLKECIEFNTQKITDVNSIYGKTYENIRKRINIKLINNYKDYVRCVSKPNFVSQKIFSKNFITVHQIKSVLTLNKPVYVGFCILELSKLLMYQFSDKYKFNAKLLFTKTHSFVYELKSEDVHEECFKDEYPVDLKFYDSRNKKVFGKMKDEFKWQIITEFIGLKSKMYSLISIANK